MNWWRFGGWAFGASFSISAMCSGEKFSLAFEQASTSSMSPFWNRIQDGGMRA